MRERRERGWVSEREWVRVREREGVRERERESDIESVGEWVMSRNNNFSQKAKTRKDFFAFNFS
jgi:hypothetical protein